MVGIQCSWRTRDHRLAKAAFAAAYAKSEQLFQQSRLTGQATTKLVAVKQPLRQKIKQPQAISSALTVVRAAQVLG